MGAFDGVKHRRLFGKRRCFQGYSMDIHSLKVALHGVSFIAREITLLHDEARRSILFKLPIQIHIPEDDTRRVFNAHFSTKKPGYRRKKDFKPINLKNFIILYRHLCLTQQPPLGNAKWSYRADAELFRVENRCDMFWPEIHQPHRS